MPESPRFRVELHAGGVITVVGFLPSGFAHHSTLEPYVTRLVEQGATGWLVLVAVTSGSPVARRRVQPRSRPPQLRQARPSRHPVPRD
jgi:hypothetical protein